MAIAAIETRYAGCRFRSRLEARWAVFFDHLDIRWEYEPQGFHTAEGPYLPDFWLADDEVWVEVKGGKPSKRDIKRCAAFASDQWKEGKRFRVLQGDVPKAPVFHPTIGPLGIRCVSWTCMPTDVPETGVYVPAGETTGDMGFMEMFWLPANLAKIPSGLTAARSARFEHGENG